MLDLSILSLSNLFFIMMLFFTAKIPQWPHACCGPKFNLLSHIGWRWVSLSIFPERSIGAERWRDVNTLCI
jgi:hypothetical protein